MGVASAFFAAVVVPASSAGPERTFSSVKYIAARLRGSMTEQRVSRVVFLYQWIRFRRRLETLREKKKLTTPVAVLLSPIAESRVRGPAA